MTTHVDTAMVMAFRDMSELSRAITAIAGADRSPDADVDPIRNKSPVTVTQDNVRPTRVIARDGDGGILP